LEWRNIRTIISQAADENLGKYKAFTQEKKLKILDNEIKSTVQQKNSESKMYLQTKTTANESEYNCRRAITTIEVRNRHHK